MVTFKEMAEFMDPVEPPKTLRELSNLHRWAPGEERFSFRNMARRHTSSERIDQRFLFLNTFLMWCNRLFRRSRKPVAWTRVNEISRAIRNRKFDIAALAEVFRENMKDTLLNGWPSDERPAYVDAITRRCLNSTGLLTISEKFNWTRRKVHKFEVEGGMPDSLADKGVLMMEIDFGLPDSRLEIFSTHMVAEGRDKLHPRLVQVAELVSFFRRTHAPRNVAMIVGDFNIHRHDDGPFKWPPPDVGWGAGVPPVAWSEVIAELLGETYEPISRTPYQHLTEMFRIIDMEDLWEERSKIGGRITPGYTSKFKESGVTDIICLPDGAEGEFCDDNVPSPRNLMRDFPDIFQTEKDLPDRVDYIFVQEPMEEHEISIDFTRPRRTRLKRPSDAPGLNEIDFMSDHAGLTTTLRVVPKT